MARTGNQEWRIGERNGKPVLLVACQTCGTEGMLKGEDGEPLQNMTEEMIQTAERGEGGSLCWSCRGKVEFLAMVTGQTIGQVVELVRSHNAEQGRGEN